MTKVLKNSFVLAETKKLFSGGKEKWVKGSLARMKLTPEQYELDESGTRVMHLNIEATSMGKSMNYDYELSNTEHDPATGARKVTGVYLNVQPNDPRAECFCMLGGVAKVLAENGADMKYDEFGNIEWEATAAQYCMEFVACDTVGSDDDHVLRAQNYRDGEFYSSSSVYHINDRPGLEYGDFLNLIGCAVDVATKLDGADERKG